MNKGDIGYTSKRRKKLILYLIIVILIAVAIFAIGYVINNYSTKNIFSIAAVLMVLPGAKVLVSLIIIIPFKGIMAEEVKLINMNIIDEVNVLYDLVLTSPDKIMYIRSFAMSSSEYLVYLDNSKQDKAYIKEYLYKHLNNYGFGKDVYVTDKIEEYTRRLEENREESKIDDVEEVKKCLMILHV